MYEAFVLGLSVPLCVVVVFSVPAVRLVLNVENDGASVECTKCGARVECPRCGSSVDCTKFGDSVECPKCGGNVECTKLWC